MLVVGCCRLQSTKDQMALDIWIPLMCGSLLANIFQLSGILYVTIHITWQIIFIIAPLFIVFIQYQVDAFYNPNFALL
jgi:uncharacterized membrane protein